jgi:hypothetical protein
VCRYTSFSTPTFTVGSGQHTLTLQGFGGILYPDPSDPRHGDDYTAFIDDVDVVPVQ